ncbi:MAG: hypothetical protein ACOH2V_06050 [Candidatus Saccharimonadaceae bacterium]
MKISLKDARKLKSKTPVEMFCAFYVADILKEKAVSIEVPAAFLL